MILKGHIKNQEKKKDQALLSLVSETKHMTHE